MAGLPDEELLTGVMVTLAPLAVLLFVLPACELPFCKALSRFVFWDAVPE